MFYCSNNISTSLATVEEKKKSSTASPPAYAIGKRFKGLHYWIAIYFYYNLIVFASYIFFLCAEFWHHIYSFVAGQGDQKSQSLEKRYFFNEKLHPLSPVWLRAHILHEIAAGNSLGQSFTCHLLCLLGTESTTCPEMERSVFLK